MSRPASVLSLYLRQPERLATASPETWDRLVPMARAAGLLGRIAAQVERAGGLDAVPPPVRPHLLTAKRLAEKQRRDTLYNVDCLTELLQPALGRIILLKGAAYLCADLPPALGRIFSDIDILVPRGLLAHVEGVLGLAGWRTGDIAPYDDSYYRRWMHQLPPLVNEERGSAVDVHHTIVPLTARVALSADELLKEVVPLPDRPALAILSPPDLVLHSIVHLFSEGEFMRGLRDLDDINLLLRDFARTPGFWEMLTRRALVLDLTRPLFYALRYATALLATPVPDDVMRLAAQWAPPRPALAVMDGALRRGLCAPHPDDADRWTGPALTLLYVRAHYLRMPLHLLAMHLTRKSVMRSTVAKPAEAAR
jgi:Uncharacterised nucleotidyltransferase